MAMLHSFRYLAPATRRAGTRGIIVMDLDIEDDPEKSFNMIHKTLMQEKKRSPHFVKGAVKNVLRKEHKEHLKLKSKVHNLLSWVEFKQKHRV